MRTRNISKSVIKDAINVAGGLYGMNAISAHGYAFTCSRNGKSVNYGEFVFAGEFATVERFDGYINFKSKILFDLKSNEMKELNEN